MNAARLVVALAPVALLCGFQDAGSDPAIRVDSAKKNQRFEARVSGKSKALPPGAVLDFTFKKVSLGPDLTRGGLFRQSADNAILYSAQIDKTGNVRFDIFLRDAGYYELTVAFLEQSQVVMDIRSKFETQYYPFANKQTILIGSQKNVLDRISNDLAYLGKRIRDGETMVQEIEKLLADPEPERDYKGKAAAVDRLIVELDRERQEMVLAATASALERILFGWKAALEQVVVARAAKQESQNKPKEEVKNNPPEKPSGELKPEQKIKGMSVEPVPDLKVVDSGGGAPASTSTSDYKVDKNSIKLSQNHMQMVWKILNRETGLYLLWLARDIYGAGRTVKLEDTRLRADLESRLEALVKFDQALRGDAAYAKETSIELRDPKDDKKTRPMGLHELLAKLQELLTLSWTVLETPSDADKSKKLDELQPALKDFFEMFERHFLS